MQQNTYSHFKLSLKKDYKYTDLLKNYLIPLICFTNYQYELVEGYTYTLPNDNDIKKYIDNFKTAFLGDGNKKKEKRKK